MRLPSGAAPAPWPTSIPLITATTLFVAGSMMWTLSPALLVWMIRTLFCAAAGFFRERVDEQPALDAARHDESPDSLKVPAAVLLAPRRASGCKRLQPQRGSRGMTGHASRMPGPPGHEDRLHAGLEELVIQRSGGTRGRTCLGADVPLRKLLEVGRVHQADLARLCDRGIPRPAVPHDASNQPERADADRCRAVDEHWTVRRIIAEPEEFGHLFVARIGIDDRQVEVLQAGLFCGRPLVRLPILARRPQVQDRPDAIALQSCERFGPRLAAGAEVRVHLQKISD